MVSSKDAAHPTLSAWQSDSVYERTSPTSEQEINITQELVTESIAQFTTNRSDVTAENFLLNVDLAKNNVTNNYSMQKNVRKSDISNNNHDIKNFPNNNTIKTDLENISLSLTQPLFKSLRLNLDETTVLTKIIDSNDPGRTPKANLPKVQDRNFHLHKKSLNPVQAFIKTGRVIDKINPKWTRKEDLISLDHRSSSNIHDSILKSGNENDYNQKLIPFLSIDQKKLYSDKYNGEIIREYMDPYRSMPLDWLRIFKLIIEKQALNLDRKILEMLQNVGPDSNINWNIIDSIVALCKRSGGISNRVYEPVPNYQNLPFSLLPLDLISKPEFTEYVASNQPIKSSFKAFVSNINPSMIGERLWKDFLNSHIVDMYDTSPEIDVTRKMNIHGSHTLADSNHQEFIHNLKKPICKKTNRSCFLMESGISCKPGRLICKTAIINKDEENIREIGSDNLIYALPNLEDVPFNLQSGTFDFKNALPVSEKSIPVSKIAIPFLKDTLPQRIHVKNGKYKNELENFVGAILKILLQAGKEFQNRKKSKEKFSQFESLMIPKKLEDPITQAIEETPKTIGSKPAKIVPNKIDTDLLTPIKNQINYKNPTKNIYTSNFAGNSQKKTPAFNSKLMTKNDLNFLDYLLSHLREINSSFHHSSIRHQNVDQLIPSTAGSVSINSGSWIKTRGSKNESIGNEAINERAFTSEPIIGASDILPTLSELENPASISVNQSVLNEMTPTLKSAEPVALAKHFETIHPSVDQLVSLTNQLNESFVTDRDANPRKASVYNFLLNQEYQSGKNFNRDIHTNLEKNKNPYRDRSTNLNLNSNLDSASASAPGISISNSLGNLHQTLMTKPEATNSMHVNMNVNQDSNVNINQDLNLRKLRVRPIVEQLQEPIKMQLPVSVQAEHQNSVAGNIGTLGWNTKKDFSFNKNRDPSTNENQNGNRNQIKHIASSVPKLPGLLTLVGSSNLIVNPSNQINKNVQPINFNMAGNIGISTGINSETLTRGQQTLAKGNSPQDISVGDVRAVNTNLNHNANVNRDYNANLRLQMPGSIILRPPQPSKIVQQPQNGEKSTTKSNFNYGVNSKFRAHANVNLNLGKGFNLIKKALTKTPILSKKDIGRKIMRLSSVDPNSTNNMPMFNLNQNQSWAHHLNEREYQNFNHNQSQNQNRNSISNQIQNHYHNLHLNLERNENNYHNSDLDKDVIKNKNEYKNEDLNTNQYQSKNENQYQSLSQTQNENQYQNPDLNYQNSNHNQNRDQNQNKDINYDNSIGANNQKKEKGWYELWYNDGEEKDD